MPENEYGSIKTEEEAQIPPDRSQRLTNEDFRKLLMTPRSSVPSSLPTAPSRDAVPPTPDAEGEDRAERRRKKKSFYAKLKKQEDDKMAELAKKYRDRAGERRDGANPDYQAEDPLSTASGYRAVAPDLKSGMDAAERRRQMIQESKFLGGDMEHTHLVKGLDYALLQKVRSEIQAKEQEQEEEMEKLVKTKKERKDEEEEMQFKTRLGRNIYRAVFKMRPAERNELFVPGRMAYVVDLEDELAESDIPTTLIRSRQDVPALESTATLTTNDIVINKLAQILSYLRAGGRHGRKGKKKGAAAAGKKLAQPQDDSIYGEIGDYIPTGRRQDGRTVRSGPYFEKPGEGDGDDVLDDRPTVEEHREPEPPPPQAATAPAPQARRQEPSRAQQLLTRLAAEPEGYAECYPGLEEMQDAIDDSDDEVDYTKMDLGNKKGPIGRWDFDTQEEYSDYMNSKEALPKAAFQYGVKMADGRRTRKYHKEKNEKAELDREWQKIQNIIQKRRIPGPVGPEPDFKKPKY
ncbi:protein Red [Schistocerca americana]|uniref:protein Red n=1 Tax=Schistocerca americana TaxID=7009 RepID=UPI001F4FD27E|nr:protein Red [Schistocerca americana]XP_047098069.1 protein Red [Schistocerca piceifrons]XP_049766647.1 protein Red [Schistocerca cancellata]XP_049793304.1 protein Red [Schistocerca nitens]XP_049839796.1 protein Red [Schistocerca gregaria]XP_049942049.1 protein Red [Schistocerca serialis cubense]